MNASGASSPLALLALLRGADSAYPTGGYAHSHGLEGLVESGVVGDVETLGLHCRTSVIPSLRELDLPLAMHLYAALQLDAPDWDRAAEAGRAALAVRSSLEARAATEAIGRQRVELLDRLHPSAIAGEWLARRLPHSTPAAAALEARVLGLAEDGMRAGLVFSALAGQIAAAMKLLRIGQNAAQTLLARLLEEAAPLVPPAPPPPLGDLGWASPWLDIASARHARATSRMFIS